LFSSDRILLKKIYHFTNEYDAEAHGNYDTMQKSPRYNDAELRALKSRYQSAS
jgi:hypothetical protein